MMVMDREGTAGRLAQWAAIGAVALTLIAGVVSVTRSVGEIQGQLDRNCRLIAALDRDVRILVLLHVEPPSAGGEGRVAEEISEILKKDGVDAC